MELTHKITECYACGMADNELYITVSGPGALVDVLCPSCHRESIAVDPSSYREAVNE